MSCTLIAFPESGGCKDFGGFVPRCSVDRTDHHFTFADGFRSGLALNGFGISGTLPAAISDLSALTYARRDHVLSCNRV